MREARARVVVIGADGQLGADLMLILGKRFEVVGFTQADFDVTDGLACGRAIGEAKPAFVINTAAMHNVPDCERDPEKCFSVNAAGAYFVAKAAADAGAGIVFISTDYVFGGEKRSYAEDDRPHPLNVYGASKLAGESLTAIANANHYIVRTCGLFGIHPSKKGHTFVTKMLLLAREGKDISVVNDQFVAPTFTEDLAEKIGEMIERHVAPGVYHVVNSGGGLSWYEFAKEIFATAGVSPNLKPTSTAGHSDGIARPKATVLEMHALARAGLAAPRPLSDALRAYIGKLDGE